MESELEIPQELYDAETSFSISCFWDGGFEVAIGIEPNFDEAGRTETYLEACCWLKRAALRHYPESTFARKHRGAAKVVTLPVRP